MAMDISFPYSASPFLPLLLDRRVSPLLNRAPCFLFHQKRNFTLRRSQALRLAVEGEISSALNIKGSSSSSSSSPSDKDTPISSTNRSPGPESPRKASPAPRRSKPGKSKAESHKSDGPPLVCCFGEALYEFIPTVKMSTDRMDPDIYSTWKALQWRPPEFVRAPGGSAFNMAIALKRLGCESAFMGMVGNDEFGRFLLQTLHENNVQVHGTRVSLKFKTAVSRMRLSFENERVQMSCIQSSAEEAFLQTDITVDILKQANMFYFTSFALTVTPIRSTLLAAIELSKSNGCLTFFDLNLSLQLWKSSEETWSVIREAWDKANVIEVTKQEFEFLLGEEEFIKRRRRSKSQYAAKSENDRRRWPDDIHYTRDDVGKVWHDNLKMLFVTDGTLQIHYYSPCFDGYIRGTEDVLVAPYTCDRTGSGDAIVAGIIKKLITLPELFENQERLEKSLRFAVCAGIIAQWTIGAVRGFPTESAAQNLTEQVYIPSLVEVQS